MRKITEFFCGLLATILTIEGIGILVLFAINSPSSENEYGYYTDTHDLQRFDGVKGDIYNWFIYIIEPVTDSCPTFGEAILPMIGLIAIWGVIAVCVYKLFGFVDSKCGNVPYLSLVLGTLIAAYLTPFYIFLAL